MNSKTLSNFHKFGKVGKIVVTVFMVLVILAAVLMMTATIYVKTLSKDALTVSVTSNAQFRINEKEFDSLLGMLMDSFSYSGDAVPEGMLTDDYGNIIPPEHQKFDTELTFFDQSYSSAEIYTDGDTKVIGAASSPSEYRSSDLLLLFVFQVLFAVSAAAALFLLRKLFAAVEKCDSPFREELVKKMKAFGLSLLPLAVIASASDTISTSFLSAGNEPGICIQWGVVIAFAVTMCLVTVFKYGVQLQTESDETL